MALVTISGGTVHRLPADIRTALTANKAALAKWQDLTPLGRNEWICWTTFVKQEKTRKEHVARLVFEVRAGKRRPCCWIGCIHRPDKPLSPSIKGILERRGKAGNTKRI